MAVAFQVVEAGKSEVRWDDVDHPLDGRTTKEAARRFHDAMERYRHTVEDVFIVDFDGDHVPDKLVAKGNRLLLYAGTKRAATDPIRFATQGEVLYTAKHRIHIVTAGDSDDDGDIDVTIVEECDHFRKAFPHINTSFCSLTTYLLQNQQSVAPPPAELRLPSGAHETRVYPHADMFEHCRYHGLASDPSSANPDCL